MPEKKALVEVAKEKFSETYLKKLRTLTDPERFSILFSIILNLIIQGA